MFFAILFIIPCSKSFSAIIVIGVSSDGGNDADGGDNNGAVITTATEYDL